MKEEHSLCLSVFLEGLTIGCVALAKLSSILPSSKMGMRNKRNISFLLKKKMLFPRKLQFQGERKYASLLCFTIICLGGLFSCSCHVNHLVRHLILTQKFYIKRNQNDMKRYILRRSYTVFLISIKFFQL